MTTQSNQTTTQQHTAGTRKTMASLVKPGRRDVIEWTADGNWRVVAMGLTEHEATMLAAAPDMLDEHKSILAAIESYQYGLGRVDIERLVEYVESRARLAIAKATGAQS